MRFSLSYPPALILVPVLWLALGCTLTTSTTLDPQFAVNNDSIAAHLTGMIPCEYFNIRGISKKINGKPSTAVTIRVVNSPHFPELLEKRKELALRIAREIKKDLKDPGEYDVYVVLFVVQETSGLASKSKYSSIEFKKEDL
jgi:hypothetical protein